MEIKTDHLSVKKRGDSSTNRAKKGILNERYDYFDFLRTDHIRIHDDLDIGLITLDRSNTILGTNHTAAKMLGKPGEELLGLPFMDFIYKNTHYPFELITLKPMDIRIKNGKAYFWARISARQALNPNTGTPEFQVTLRDITAQKQTEKELGWQLKVSTELESVMELLGRGDMDMEWITRRVLTAAVNLTQSGNGFISKIKKKDPEKLEIVLSDVYPPQDWIHKQSIHLPMDADKKTYMGLLGQSLNTLRPFFTTPPLGHPPLKRLPQDHIPISGFLSVPILMGKNPVGLMVLANPKFAYSQEHVKVVQRLTELYIIGRRRHQAEKEVIRLNRVRNGRTP